MFSTYFLEELLMLKEVGLMFDLGIVILLATVLGLVATYLRQPMIPVYILVGLLLNYLSLNYHIIDKETIISLSELGIAFLLFVVGMELDISKIRDVFYISVIGTVMQVFLTALISYGLLSLFGIGFYEAIVVSIAIAFSSTAIVVKYFSDKNLIDSLPGRISLGILLMQDLIVVLIIPFLEPVTNVSFATHVLDVLLKGIGLVSVTLLANRFIVRPIIKSIYKNADITFLFSLSILFIFSLISVYLGFSVAIGGFLGGIALASYPYTSGVISRLTHLRDFFIVLFFVSIGINIIPSSTMLNYIPLITALLFVVMVAKPIIIALLSIFFGYDARIGLVSGLSLSQISEFSLIIGIIAYTNGLISQEMVGVLAILLFITSFISSYFLEWSEHLAERLYPYFKPFEKISIFNLLHKPNLNEELYPKKMHRSHIVISGINTLTKLLVPEIKNKDVVVIDSDPSQVKILKRWGYEVYYGDVLDEELLKKVRVDKAKVFIYADNDFEIASELIAKVKDLNKHIAVIVRANTFNEALKLYEAGATYVYLEGSKDYKDLAKLVLKIANNDIDVNLLRTKELKMVEQENEREILALNLPRELEILKLHVLNGGKEK